MDVLLSEDELVLMRWVYEGAAGFGKDHGLMSFEPREATGLTEPHYLRAVPALREMGLAGTEPAHDTRSPSDVVEAVWLTGAGVNAYRPAVPPRDCARGPPGGRGPPRRQGRGPALLNTGRRGGDASEGQRRPRRAYAGTTSTWTGLVVLSTVSIRYAWPAPPGQAGRLKERRPSADDE